MWRLPAASVFFWRAYSTFVSAADFQEFFGAKLEHEFGLARHLGYIRPEHGGYRLTSLGAYYFHCFENFYTLAYIDKMWGIMRRYAFPERIEL